jgi:hypothetical protein
MCRSDEYTGEGVRLELGGQRVCLFFEKRDAFAVLILI